MKKNIFRDSIKINHPLAEKISVQDSEYHYCTPGKSSEIAFFMNRQFVTQPIEPFAKYALDNEGETLVYSFVPNELIETFLEEYRVSA
jgi:hypothetical protein